ncbi:MAG: pyridoxal 4-dehydrogenase [Rhodobacteraceae bacterium]|nr:MAG: pyridoxal 4-dehydrogenase [Paracoccaceae bacterium]
MIKFRKLKRHNNRSLTFTELGFGTAPLGNLYKSISDDEATRTLELAWDYGVRYYDTAPLYGLGLSETRLNRFLRGKPRDDYLISSKVGRVLKVCSPKDRDGIGKWFEVPDRNEHFDYSYDGIMRSIEFSLERLGLSRLDIIYAHDLCIFTHGSKQDSDRRINEFFQNKGYEAMLSLRDQGIVSAIGVGVNEWEVCQNMAERGDFDLFLLAGRYTLLEQDALNSFLPLCEARNIGIITGGPYNSGILASGAIPGAFYNYDPAPEKIMNKVKKIDNICREFKVPLKTAALQFPLMHPTHLAVIPGGQSASEMKNNLESINFEIPLELWEALKEAKLLHPKAPTSRLNL